jgi:hypothetical protein
VRSAGTEVEVSVLRAADPFWDEHLVQDSDVVGAEWHSRSGGVLAYVDGTLGAGDRGDGVRLGEQPGQRDLAGGVPAVVAECLELFDEPKVVGVVVTGELRQRGSEVVGAEVGVGGQTAGERRPAERVVLRRCLRATSPRCPESVVA